MSDTLMRQWHMLRLVPRHPAKRDTSKIKKWLADEGFEVTARTIQRDLMAFSIVFPLVCDDRSKPFGWSWMAHGDVMDIPGMDTHTALAFHLANKHLEPMLPRQTVRHLEPHFDRARKVLDAMHTDSGTPTWRDKIRVLRRGQFLTPPEVQPEVQQQVYDALLLNKKLLISYQARDEEKETEHEVNPLGIVLKDAVIYLVCTYWDYTDIRLITLHRISEAQKLDTPSYVPDGFNLDAYIGAGELDFPVGGEIKLEAWISEDMAVHLQERLLDQDQIISESDDDNRLLLKVTVQDTNELRWWLLGFGDQIEIVAPKSLRMSFSAIANNMVDAYR